MPPASNIHALNRFSILTAASTVCLLAAGALVTGNEAADSVPDWPLAYGRIIPPLVGGIRYEFAHRAIAATVLILTLTLAVWVSRSVVRDRAALWGWFAFALVLVQAGLGGMRVLLGHPKIIATVHATVAQIFFLTLVSLAALTSEWWNANHSVFDDSGSPRLTTLGLWTTIAILVQLVLGAGFRHGAFGILPHLIGAVAVIFLVAWTGRVAKSRFRAVPEIRRGVIWLHSTFGMQILLGFAAYWAVAESLKATQPVLLYVLIEVAHVIFGALTLAASALLTLICFRLLRPAASVAVSASAEKAGASS
ncbi:MAG TPA: hypothetical protein VEG64_06245 [Candidatus Sulfotelmatobacter sp.]|nr:hypothetical protein [Candidatus Sulfotelmatobacter sp.]